MLYHSEAIETTILTREFSLLSEMKQEVPNACTDANAELSQLSDKALQYSVKALQYFAEIINSRILGARSNY